MLTGVQAAGQVTPGSRLVFQVLSTVGPLGCGVGPCRLSLLRHPCGLFVVGVVLHAQVVVEGVCGTVDLLGGLFVDLGGSK